MKTILYTADLHGNSTQYEKLIDCAADTRAENVIIGGDLAPKEARSVQDFIEMQREFFEFRLPRYMEALKKRLPRSNIFLIMGNDDCAANTDVFEKHSGLYQPIDRKRVPLGDGFDIVGYSPVPITPFSLKDWEKFDFTDIPANMLESYIERVTHNYGLRGIKTHGIPSEVALEPEMSRTDSIQLDLRQDLFTQNPGKTVYVMHTPPNGTLDVVLTGNHVGSFAVREFIEKNQPHITLHGHIHETVAVTGRFKEKIGKTTCMAPGNTNESNNLIAIVFDLTDPDNARRVIR